MSRRDSDSRHHRSRLDPSPKRVRKTTTERTNSNLKLDSTEQINRDKKHHTVLPDSKKESVSLNKDSDKRSDGYREGTKNSSEAPRSRSHFQHDERVGHTSRHRETTQREWRKDSKSGRATNTSSNNDNDAKARYNEQIPKKRPAFRETKISVDAATTQITKTPFNADRKEEREKPQRNEMGRMKFQARDRYGGGRGRERVEKWKHDLYDEANKSPNSKNEEDQIAKVEALLSSV